MEKTKNKDILKNLYALLAKCGLHHERDEKTKQKPHEGKFKADLPQQVESGGGIIPDAKVQNTVDEDSDEKFRRGDEGGAKQTAQEKGRGCHFSIHKADHRQAKAARQDHGWVRISSPKKLQHTVSDAAHQRADDGVFPLPPKTGTAKCDLTLFQDSFPFLRFVLLHFSNIP